MNIKTLKAFTVEDSGKRTSFPFNTVVSVDDTLGEQLVTEGLAVAYDYIDTQGSINIGSNGTFDVTQYESAVVNVTIATVTYNANGGTGSVDGQTAIKGNTINLSDGTGLTAPEGKEFKGWGSTDDKTEPDVTSPYKVTENVTLYAVYGDVE